MKTRHSKTPLWTPIVIAAVLALGVTPASANDWARRMFSESGHDFGAVARAAKVEHRFEITNPYPHDIHIRGVRSSCGCTQPRIEKQTLKPNETGAIIAAFNTRHFTGRRSAQVTVIFDRPNYSEVRLKVSGYIRSDVVIHPGVVSFGSVAQGKGSEQEVVVNYAGRSDWKIVEVQTDSPYLKATPIEISRGNGTVSYKLKVELGENAPNGFLHDQLTLVTNDRRSTRVPLVVEGLVAAPIQLSPATLSLGTLIPGQTVTKRIIVRGQRPFKILAMECDDEAYQFATTDQAKPLHVVTMTFTAPDQPGKLSQTIRVRTDLELAHPTMQVTGTVSVPLAKVKP